MRVYGSGNPKSSKLASGSESESNENGPLGSATFDGSAIGSGTGSATGSGSIESIRASRGRSEIRVGVGIGAVVESGLNVDSGDSVAFGGSVGADALVGATVGEGDGVGAVQAIPIIASKINTTEILRNATVPFPWFNIIFVWFGKY